MRVLRVDTDVIVLADALGGEVVADPIAPLVDLPVRQGQVAIHEADAVRDRVDRVLEEIRDVVCHVSALSRWICPQGARSSHFARAPA